MRTAVLILAALLALPGLLLMLAAVLVALILLVPAGALTWAAAREAS